MPPPGTDLATLPAVGNQTLTWDFVKRIQDATSMKVVVKGIDTAEDAVAGVEHGVHALHISNHGGRAAESGRSTIEALPGIADAVRGRVPLIVDSGFRRGTDILKGLALGAQAVAVGRPYLWGLAAFGEAGVVQVMRLLDAELVLAMQQCGLSNLASISRSSVAPAA